MASRPASRGLIPHILSLLLIFSGTLFFLLVILYNVPLPPNTSPSNANAQDRWWLLTIRRGGQESGVNPFGLGVTDGTQEIGFGNWGWCEWVHDTAGFASCRIKAFWKIPRDVLPGDTVGTLDLPG